MYDTILIVYSREQDMNDYITTVIDTLKVDLAACPVPLFPFLLYPNIPVTCEKFPVEEGVPSSLTGVS